MARRSSPAEEEGPSHPQQENDIGDLEGAVGGGGGGPRLRDESSFSFRHFLQPHSDVVPQHPPPQRGRGGPRGGVDLVDVTMALPDFVQDHLVVESLAAGERDREPTQDLSPTRPQDMHSLDMNVLNEIMPEFSSSQRGTCRSSIGTSRRNVREPSSATSDSSHNIALPDFLSDGPMQLSSDSTAVNSPSPSAAAGRNRNRQSGMENMLVEEPGRGFESKEILRAEVERLHLELTDRNRRILQLEAELIRQRSLTSNLETSLRIAEGNLADALRRGSGPRNPGRLPNGHEGTPNGPISSSVYDIAMSSENLLCQLLENMERLKQLSDNPAGGDLLPTKDPDPNQPTRPDEP